MIPRNDSYKAALLATDENADEVGMYFFLKKHTHTNTICKEELRIQNETQRNAGQASAVTIRPAFVFMA